MAANYFTNLFADPTYTYGQGLQNYVGINQQTSLANQNILNKMYTSQANTATQNAQDQAEQAKLAAQAQIDAANEMIQQQKAQNDWIKQQYNTNKINTAAAVGQARLDLTPWRAAGKTALGTLQQKVTAGPGTFTADPGYQFRLSEGQKAIDNSAAARGGALSGAAIKAAAKYNQDFASNEYNNFLTHYYDSLKPYQDLSNVGLTAASGMGNASLKGTGLTNQALSNESNSLQSGLNALNQAVQYGGEAKATSIMNPANILAANNISQQERDANYFAWKLGNEQARKQQNIFS